MKDNIFMVSDASFSHQTKVAGMGVIDLYTGKKYSMSIENMKGAYEAELRALIYSVEIAISKGYDHVVFVYDNKGIKLDKLIKYTEDKFESSQFLWLKRVYVQEADNLALKARKLQENLFKGGDKKIISIKKSSSLSGKEILNYFKSKDKNSIILSCMIEGTNKQKKY